MPRFRDIPQFTRSANYAVDVSWHYLPQHYFHHVVDYNLNVSPTFQRGYVWTPLQKARYVEFILRGGQTGRDIYTNNPGWNRSIAPDDNYVLVDGKQRLDAVLGFLNNEFAIFDGAFRRDYSDTPDIMRCTFRWHVNDLQTNDEVLQWYIDLNAGGTVHTEDELIRVRNLIGKPYIESDENLSAVAGLDRTLFDEVKEEAAAETARRAAVVAVAAVPLTSKKKRRK